MKIEYVKQPPSYMRIQLLNTVPGDVVESDAGVLFLVGQSARLVGILTGTYTTFGDTTANFRIVTPFVKLVVDRSGCVGVHL